MADNRNKLAVFRPILEAAFNSIRDLGRPEVLRGLSMLRPHRSVDRDLGMHFRDPRVRLAFSFQSKYLGMSPFRCPSLFTILSFMEYEYGVYHPRGGTGAVIAAMAKVARELGARINLGQPVEEILFEGRRAVGVRAGGAKRRYDALVINSDFAQTMTRLVPDHLRRRWTDRKIGKKKFSCSTFMMYLGLEGAVPEIGAPHGLPGPRLCEEPRRDRGRRRRRRNPASTCRTRASPTRRSRRRAIRRSMCWSRSGTGSATAWIGRREQARYRALTLERLAPDRPGRHRATASGSRRS